MDVTRGMLWWQKHSVHFVAIHHQLMALEEVAEESDEDGKTAWEK